MTLPVRLLTWTRLRRVPSDIPVPACGRAADSTGSLCAITTSVEISRVETGSTTSALLLEHAAD